MTSDEALLHAVLYAKGHYDYDRTLKGLRYICGKYALMDPEYINDDHLLQFALLLLEKFKPNEKLDDFILEVFRESWKWREGAAALKPVTTIDRLDVVEIALSKLRYMTIDRLPKLPQADPSVYPLDRKWVPEVKEEVVDKKKHEQPLHEKLGMDERDLYYRGN
jgi:hypothetical protein